MQVSARCLVLGDVYIRVPTILTLSTISSSSSTVDFCTGNSEQSGPAGTVMGIFEERGITSEDIIYVAFQYFQSVSSTCVHGISF